MSSRAACSTQRVPGQPELHSKTLFQGGNKLTQKHVETTLNIKAWKAEEEQRVVELSSILTLYERVKKHYIKRW